MLTYEKVEYDPFAAGELTSAEPSTAPQRELWLGSLLGGEDANRAFNECLILRIEGRLSSDALRKALQALVDRHEALRGTFSPDGESFLVAKQQRAVLEEVELSGTPAERRDEEYEALKRREVETAFDLDNGPLYRATLVHLGRDSHRLLFSAHHVVCDGWSAGVLMIELAALYRAALASGDPTTAKLPRATSFTDYALSQQARETSLEGRADIDFWLQHLSAPIPVLDLPTDRARPAERTFASKRIDIEMGPELLKPLRQLGASNGCTLLVTFIGAMQVWLSGKTGLQDLVLGIPAAGQVASGEQALVGHCVHLLPVRGKLEGTRSFVEHLKATKRTMLDCFEHQQVTYSTLLPKLRIPHDPSRVALVPMCVNIDVGLEKLDFSGPDVEYETIPRCYESFEFFVNAVDHKTHLVMECSFNTTLFEESTIRQWVDEFFSLVRKACEAPQTTIAELSAVSAPKAVTSSFDQLNATDVPLSGLAVHERFRRQANVTPHAEAVRFAQQTLSYAELEKNANQLAHLLLQHGVSKGECVGVGMPRSEHLLTVLLGILKAGASYVPMDPAYPKARLQAMADDGHVRLVVGHSASSERLPVVQKQLFIDELLPQLPAYPSTAPEIMVKPSDRAYVLFTSGSTGRPKGVDVPHGAFENVLQAIAREPGFRAGERLLAVTTISFDIAGVELFMPLICGGTVVVCSAEEMADPFELKRLLEAEQIDYMQATPATWTMLLDSGWSGNSKIRVVSTGEAFPPELAKPLLERAGGGVWNLYGPTETCVYSSRKKLVPNQRVTIGKPLDNTQFYILDEGMKPVAPGAVGELWIGGVGVTDGYIGRPELTQERFVPDPFRVGHRMYKSGDLARLNEDGEVECLGRIDFQVKVRGFRIELGEIEAAIAEVDGVRRSLVDVRELAEGDQRIVAYVAAQPGFELDPAAVLAHLSDKLTPYMLPQHIVLVDTMPTTPNGKVDRKALAALPLSEKPTPRSKNAAASAGAAHNDDANVEQRLSEIWRELLRVERVEPDASFFDLGGHSMLAVRMVSRVREAFQVELPLRTVFQLQTIRGLADFVVSRRQQNASGNSSPSPTTTNRTAPVASSTSPTVSSPPAAHQPENSPALNDPRAQLVEIWKTLLRVDQVDPNTSFFDLGGHSMLAVRMLSRIRETLGVEVPLKVIFQVQTVDGIATWLQDKAGHAGRSPQDATTAPGSPSSHTSNGVSKKANVGLGSDVSLQLEEIEF